MWSAPAALVDDVPEPVPQQSADPVPGPETAL
jgi:hypothetical protein